MPQSNGRTTPIKSQQKPVNFASLRLKTQLDVTPEGVAVAKFHNPNKHRIQRTYHIASCFDKDGKPQDYLKVEIELGPGKCKEIPFPDIYGKVQLRRPKGHVTKKVIASNKASLRVEVVKENGQRFIEISKIGDAMRKAVDLSVTQYHQYLHHLKGIRIGAEPYRLLVDKNHSGLATVLIPGYFKDEVKLGPADPPDIQITVTCLESGQKVVRITNWGGHMLYRRSPQIFDPATEDNAGMSKRLHAGDEVLLLSGEHVDILISPDWPTTLLVIFHSVESHVTSNTDDPIGALLGIGEQAKPSNGPAADAPTPKSKKVRRKPRISQHHSNKTRIARSYRRPSDYKTYSRLPHRVLRKIAALDRQAGGNGKVHWRKKARRHRGKRLAL